MPSMDKQDWGPRGKHREKFFNGALFASATLPRRSMFVAAYVIRNEQEEECL